MESSPGKNAPSLITRRVEANTTCFIPDTQHKPSGGGGDPEFAVQLKCNVTKYIRAGPKRGQTRVFVYRGGGAEASFAAAGANDVPVDEDGVRGVMRRLLRAIRPLRELDLTDGEWEAILPEDVVPLLADLSRRRRRDGSHAAAVVVEMAVDLHVRYRQRAQAAGDVAGCTSGSACMHQQQDKSD